MTREEKINILRGMQADNLNLDDAYIKDKYEALDTAIKVLEQEPCEDAISREEAIDACNQSVNILEATDRIKDLPPVTPKAKEQKWIPVSEKLPELGEAVLTYHEDDEEYQINWVTDDETVEWFYENPIAWMSLPEPYKEESEDKKI